MWGFGSPDDGEPVCVRNYGVPGYNSTQSVNLLISELQSKNIPDLVIFYDGVNEVSGPYLNGGVPNTHLSMEFFRQIANYGFDGKQDIRFFKEFLSSTFHIFNWALQNSFPQPELNLLRRNVDVAALGADIAQVYLTNYRIVREMADEFGFDIAFFWQPVLILDEKPLTPIEQQRRDQLVADDLAAEDNLTDLHAITYEQVQAAADQHDKLHYIADVFEDVEEHVWTDGYHPTPYGNQIIAASMLELLNGWVSGY